MKKFVTSIACMAVAIAGMGFASCSSDDLAETNPNYDPGTKEVYANLVINVSTGHSGSRQSAAVTQATTDQTFRGIVDTKLFTYKLTNDGSWLSEDQSGLKVYDFGTSFSSGDTYVDGDYADTNGRGKSHRIFELGLPLGTNALVFYGRAAKGSPRSGISQENEFGKIDWNLVNGADDTHFDLMPRLSNSVYTTQFQKEQQLVAGVLTQIILTGINGTQNFNNTSAVVSYNGDTFDGRLTWQEYYYRKLKGETLLPLEEVLATSYETFTTISTNELRAGDAATVALYVGDLAQIIKSVKDAIPTSIGEAKAKEIGNQVYNHITEYFDYNATTHACTWKSMPVVAASLITHTRTVGSTDNSTSPYYEHFDNIMSRDLSQFPVDYDVPVGATYLTFAGTTTTTGASTTWEDHRFLYAETYNTSGMGGATNITALNYVYPAELCYFSNSPIRVSDTEHNTDTYPNGTAKWNNETSWTSEWTSPGHVLSTTRSVAMTHDVNYGTALLKTTVRYGANVLQDNNQHFHSAEANKTFTVDDVARFELTGVIVGGQPGVVGWNFLRKDVTDTSDRDSVKFDKLLYDKALNDGAGAIPTYTAAGAKSNPNYTLVWDNYNSSNYANSTDQDKVYVALEFVNNSGKDFWGKDNLIRSGSKFYLIGELDPTSVTLDYTLGNEYKDAGGTHTYHALPPYTANGSTIDVPRVFIQDHTTTADFVIGATSLQNAYYTVPDLRSSQLSLGISVDMKWETGLTFPSVNL